MLEEITYHKIQGPFKREVSGANKNKLIPWAWTSPELEFLADVVWKFTEKIDGTNIRVIWDGHKPQFKGRTERSALPAKLVTTLIDMFPEELLEQTFGPQPAILFGEGYGAGIQKGGGNYRKDNSFILFDVYVGDLFNSRAENSWWLQRDSVEDIANSLGIDVAPIRFTDLTLRQAITAMADDSVSALWSNIAEVDETIAEGVVGTPAIPLFTRKGDRIIVKLKVCDLYGLDLTQEDRPASIES